MKYLTDEGFSVSMGGTEAYRNGWDNIFNKGADVKKHPDGAYLTLDGTIHLREYKGGKEVSAEPIDGEMVLKLVISALERGLELLTLDGAKKPVRKARRTK